MEIEEIRKILGQAANNYSDEELKEEIIKLDLIAEALLDFAEKEIFNGKTLTEAIPDLLAQKNKMNWPEENKL